MLQIICTVSDYAFGCFDGLDLFKESMQNTWALNSALNFISTPLSLKSKKHSWQLRQWVQVKVTSTKLTEFLSAAYYFSHMPFYLVFSSSDFL